MALLEGLRAEAPPGVERSDVLFELATTRRTDSGEMTRLCDEALGDASGDGARCARLLAFRSYAYLFGGEVVPALLSAREALARAQGVGDPALVAVAIARVGVAELHAGHADIGLLERGAQIEESLGLALEYSDSPGVALGARADASSVASMPLARS